MASLEGPGGSQPAALPPSLGPSAASMGNTGSFLEPISGRTIARTNDRPVYDWISGLPHTDVGLSTLNRWQRETRRRRPPARSAPSCSIGSRRSPLAGG